MSFKQVIELADLLDDAGLPAKMSSNMSPPKQCQSHLHDGDGRQGQHRLREVPYSGQERQDEGRHAPTLGIVGRLGGLVPPGTHRLHV